MITEGFVLNQLYKNGYEYVLAISETDGELDFKKDELTKLNNERRERFKNSENIRTEYFEKFKNYMKVKGNLNYEIENFVTANPIPEEISEFVTYIKDRSEILLYCKSASDFDVEFYVSNILGFKGLK